MGVLGLRQINTFTGKFFQMTIFAQPSVSLIFLRFNTIQLKILYIRYNNTHARCHFKERRLPCEVLRFIHLLSYLILQFFLLETPKIPPLNVSIVKNSHAVYNYQIRVTTMLIYLSMREKYLIRDVKNLERAFCSQKLTDSIIKNNFREQRWIYLL